MNGWRKFSESRPADDQLVLFLTGGSRPAVWLGHFFEVGVVAGEKVITGIKKGERWRHVAR